MPDDDDTRVGSVAVVRSPAAPNRVVALVSAGRGNDLAAGVVRAVGELWSTWVRRTFDGQDRATPGMPNGLTRSPW